MSGVATGFARVTVVTPDRRIDVALPEDLPLADLYPDVLRLARATQPDGVPTGFHLVRRDGTVLDGGLSLAAQQVRDGDLLALRPFAESLPPAVYDDVADAIAGAVSADHRFWSPELTRAFGLTGATVLLALLGLALWSAGPHHDAHGLPGVLAGVTAVVLTALAGVRARVYGDAPAAVALGLGALPHALIAGTGLLAAARPGEGPGRLQFLAGCVAVLVTAVLLAGLLPERDAVFVAAALAAAAGALAAFAAVLLPGTPAYRIAAVTGVAAVAAIGFLPGLAARGARLPVGYAAPGQTRGEADGEHRAETVPYERIARQARRGHEVLVGLVGGCAAVVAGACALLGFTDAVFPELLALALGLAVMLRARLFRYTAQVLALTSAGLLGLALLIAGLSLHARQFAQDAAPADADLRTLWLTAAVALGAAALTAVALVVPRLGVSPFWGRVLDLVDGLALLSLVPLALAVLDVYRLVRGATG
ncbi:type VII secretion integral membrane protein EccD [Streptomyces sp. SP17BM10]|uniref:type VII secretion integral membrane protein EccD n=1 Tax=Streptomyces sp. SP17BM10 TaxID=3002530 RepID=UPI002E79CC01|nr:type VII secretion integral membrane protein EccD [Streptomyces sp. SP17BM10]MEE1785540.1 type VII secretion integral membrane protein EccD [Streptomyces sp. SP17BM10]